MSYRQARYQAATACRLMAMGGNRNASVSHRFVTFLDQVRPDIGVEWTRNLVTLTGHELAIKAHRGRGAYYFATVVGGITQTNQIHHFQVPNAVKVELSLPDVDNRSAPLSVRLDGCRTAQSSLERQNTLTFALSGSAH